ncbi:MAG TPA: type II toxin-antitoxin system RelE/ParE family toxin [Candidatus Obscuribacterales bacterium]
MDEYRVIVEMGAVSDLDEAMEWYEDRRRGLGFDLVMRFEDALAFLRSNPKIYQKVLGEFRRVLMKKYPYAIYYALEGKEVLVVAVWQTGKNPEVLRKRLGIE